MKNKKQAPLWETRQIAIKRLEATIEMISNLKSKQFNYQNFVTKADKENTCGTVCCVAGWYPMYFPKSNLIYEILFDNTLSLSTKDNHSAAIELLNYHKLNYNVIYSLFYGHDLYVHNIITNDDKLILENIEQINMSETSLKEVKQRFKTILKLIKNKELDNLLIR